MDKYTIDEIQYKNGYRKGYEDGKKDAVEVVRCKDCKHWSYIPGLDKCPHCVVFCGLHSKAYQTKSDDFCSYGERKESEQT